MATGRSRRGGIHLLLAVDGSSGAGTALDLVATLVRPVDEVTVVMYPDYLLTSRPDRTGLIGRLMEGRRDAARKTVDEAVRRLGGRGAHANGVVAEGLEPVDGILRVAAARSPDLIVIGSHGRGAVGSFVLGSTARSLAQISPVPVLVVRELRSGPRRVLVAVDGSEASHAALTTFARLPFVPDAEVELLHVLPAREWSDTSVDDKELAGLRQAQERTESAAGEKILSASARALPKGMAFRAATDRGRVSDTIRAHADAMDADLIVLGTRGLSGPRRPFWGSTAENVIAGGRRSVLVAPVPTKTRRPTRRSPASARVKRTVRRKK